MSYFQSTKVIELGSCAFRQWRANPELATSGLTRNNNRCFLVHGYQLKAKFTFGCSSLDERNWVTDFGSLKPLKEFLNKQFDHTLCIAEDDPALDLFNQLHAVNACDLRVMKGVGIEKTAEFCFDAATSFLREAYGDRCWVVSVEVFEHENNSALFYGDKKAENNTIQETEPVQLTVPEPIINNNQPVKIGNNGVTSGYSGLFDGISWGSR